MKLGRKHRRRGHRGPDDSPKAVQHPELGHDEEVGHEDDRRRNHQRRDDEQEYGVTALELVLGQSERGHRIEEQRDLLHDVFAEVLEDFALTEAVREGQKTKPATRAEVFRVLQAKP